MPFRLDRFFRNPKTGKIVVMQVPNLPLWIFLVATAARLATHPAGTLGTATSVVSGLALLWWTIGEIGWGESPFRRVLGAGVLLMMVVSRVMG